MDPNSFRPLVRNPVSWTPSPEIPPGGAKFRLVGAVRARTDGAVEMLAELRVTFTDPGHRPTERMGHSGPCAFGCGSGSRASTAQADRAGQFSNQEVAFGGGLRCTFDVAGCLRVLDVLVDLDEAAAGGAAAAAQPAGPTYTRRH